MLQKINKTYAYYAKSSLIIAVIFCLLRLIKRDSFNQCMFGFFLAIGTALIAINEAMQKVKTEAEYHKFKRILSLVLFFIMPIVCLILMINVFAVTNLKTFNILTLNMHTCFIWLLLISLTLGWLVVSAPLMVKFSLKLKKSLKTQKSDNNQIDVNNLSYLKPTAEKQHKLSKAKKQAIKQNVPVSYYLISLKADEYCDKQALTNLNCRHALSDDGGDPFGDMLCDLVGIKEDSADLTMKQALRRNLQNYKYLPRDYQILRRQATVLDAYLTKNNDTLNLAEINRNLHHTVDIVTYLMKHVSAAPCLDEVQTILQHFVACQIWQNYLAYTAQILQDDKVAVILRSKPYANGKWLKIYYACQANLTDMTSAISDLDQALSRVAKKQRQTMIKTLIEDDQIDLLPASEKVKYYAKLADVNQKLQK